MKTIRISLSLLFAAVCISGCATQSDIDQGGSGSTFLDDDGYGFDDTMLSSPTMRPGMRSGDVRDPSVFTQPLTTRP